MVEKGDFILVELEGKDNKGRTFDSTKGEIAKKLHGKEGPLLIIYGMDKLIPGIYNALTNMAVGEEKQLHLSVNDAFGERKKDLIKIMSETEFAKHRVRPEPGLIIHVDTDTGRLYGTVKNVTAGRVMVDFNHPIAAQEVDYYLKLNEVHSKTDDKIKVLLNYLGLNGTFVLDASGTLALKLQKKKDSDYELHKAMALITLKSKIPGINKVELTEE